MRRFVEGDIEVLALLVCASDSSTFCSFRKGACAGADFAIHNIIVESFARLDRAVDEVFADVVDYACDFSYLNVDQHWQEHSRLVKAAYFRHDYGM